MEMMMDLSKIVVATITSRGDVGRIPPLIRNVSGYKLKHYILFTDSIKDPDQIDVLNPFDVVKVFAGQQRFVYGMQQYFDYAAAKNYLLDYIRSKETEDVYVLWLDSDESLIMNKPDEVVDVLNRGHMAGIKMEMAIPELMHGVLNFGRSVKIRGHKLLPYVEYALKYPIHETISDSIEENKGGYYTFRADQLSIVHRGYFISEVEMQRKHQLRINQAFAAMEVYGKSPHILRHLARSYVYFYMFPKAIECYEEAISLIPEDHKPSEMQASIQLEIEKLKMILREKNGDK